MNLLKEGLEQKVVIKTTLTRKLTIDGFTKAYPVYKVKLDQLYYNDQNDRIATWISQYNINNGRELANVENQEDYNNIIEKFIIESNPDSIRRTRKNIELVEQREPGVVLADGRIIDGNRRYTCLRELAKSNDHFNYFETVILDRDIESNAKQIKILELSIQHGEESKVDYNPIDRLVGLYKDIIERKLLTVSEYAKSTNEAENDIYRKLELAKLLIEFLEFFKMSKQYYIARDLQIYYPLEELNKLLKKCLSDITREDLKTIVFSNIIMQTEGDMTRFVRKIKNIINTEFQDGFIAEQKEISKKVLQSFKTLNTIDSNQIKKVIRENSEIGQELSYSMDKTLIKVKKNEVKNRPIQLIEKAITFIESIDTNMFLKMNNNERQRFIKQIDVLENEIKKIQAKI